MSVPGNRASLPSNFPNASKTPAGRPKSEGSRTEARKPSCIWPLSEMKEIVKVILVCGIDCQVRYVNAREEPVVTGQSERWTGDSGVVWSTDVKRSLMTLKYGYAGLNVVMLPSKAGGSFIRSLRLSGDYNHYFFFRTMLPALEPEQIFGSYQCLLHYADWLLQSSTEAFPELIEQLPEIDCLPSEMQRIYKLCAQHIAGHALNSEKAGCLFALIGVLKPEQTQHSVTGYQRILDCVDDSFMTEIRLCAYKRFTAAVSEGFKWCLAWSLRHGERQWKAVKLLRPDQELFQSTLSFLSSTLIETREDQMQDWFEVLQLLPSPEQLRCIQHFASITKGYTALYALVSAMHPIFPATQTANLEVIKEAAFRIKSRNWRLLTSDEASRIVDQLNTVPESAREFFYQSGITALLADFLQFPSASNLPTYKRLFTSEARLIGKLDVQSFLLKLALDAKLGLAGVIAAIPLSKEEQVILATSWMHALRSRYGSNRFLLTVDAEICRIGNTSVQLEIIETAIKLELELLGEKLESLIHISEAVDALSCELLQISLLDAWPQKSTSLHNHHMLAVLVQKRSQNAQSRCIQQLLKYEIAAVTHLSYEEIEGALLNSRVIDPEWICVAEQLSKLSDFSFSNGLVESVEQFATRIVKKEMLINKIELILRKTEQEQHQLSEFVQQVLRIRLSGLAHRFDAALQQSLQEIKCIEANCDTFAEFHKNTFFLGSIEKERILVTLSSFKETYRSVSLATLQYPSELESMQVDATAIDVSTQSALMKHYLANQSLDFAKFLETLSEEQLKYMLECVNDLGEPIVTVEAVKDLEKLWRLWSGIQSDNDVYRLAADLQHSGMDLIKACAINLNSFKRLISGLEDRAEVSCKLIEALLRKSTYVFTWSGYAFDVQAKSPGIVGDSLCLADLAELKARAMLTLRTAAKEQEQLLMPFISLVEENEGIVYYLAELRSFGYWEYLAEEVSCQGGDFKLLTQLRKDVEDTLKHWKLTVQSAYERFHLLTYSHGAQFWELEAYLQGTRSSQTAASLLFWMGKQLTSFQILPACAAEDRLQHLAQALHSLPTLASKPEDSQQTGTRGKGLMLYLLISEERRIAAVLSLYHHTNRGIPKEPQVLFCSNRTIFAEIQAFLYRCFASAHAGLLYTLVGCELLSLETQTLVQSLFHSLKLQNRQFGLAIVTSNADCLLSEYFYRDPQCFVVEEAVLLSDEDLGRTVENIQSSFSSTSIVVTSSEAGAGKTSWCLQHAIHSKKELVEFPIAGHIDVAELCTRLSAVAKPGVCLHLTLHHVNSPQALNDLLTSLVIFRTLKADCLVEVVPANVDILIEVQNLQPSLLNHLPFLKHLAHVNVNFDIRELQLESRAVFVAQYLSLYHKNALNDSASDHLSEEEMRQLFEEYCFRPQLARGQTDSYHSFAAFIQVMSKLIGRFERSAFSQSCIIDMIQDLSSTKASKLERDYLSLRQTIFQGLLSTAEELCTPYREEGAGHMRSNYEESNHFAFFFLPDSSHCAIYRNAISVPAPLRQLLCIQSSHKQTLLSALQNQQYEVMDYANMSAARLLEQLQVYAKPGTRVDDRDYVLTADNFIKMHLIRLRADLQLPIIIMGETGCGKTSLIKFFVERVLGEQLTVISIHAGVTSAAFARLFADVAAKVAAQPDQRHWVFFDEFNTSDCLGQICQILCERKLNGVEIPGNMLAVGACNPYRIHLSSFERNNIGLKKAGAPIHLVKPLPETCLQYIWDFGSLTDIDMRRYVRAMIEKSLPEDLVDIFTRAICASQIFFQAKEDISSVSLRDVIRFTIFYDWLLGSLSSRRSTYLQSFSDLPLFAAVLALCSCYYYRLTKLQDKTEYLEVVTATSEGRLSVASVQAMLASNEMDLAMRMQLPRNVALNQTFRENVSCLITCIFTKVALFICGKPGCSKSLAVQVVLDSLRGEQSEDAYLRTLPELVLVPFQGSETCTSDGVLRVFERAQRYIKGTLNILPIVVFDEIGLAEISKENPLKVLHTLLEIENREVAFVGLSNWRLDASKMNRAMFLARPDPSLEELQLTAESIYHASIHSKPVQSHIEIVSNLAAVYKEWSLESTEFYGLRDFYYLIKQVAAGLSSDEVQSASQEALLLKHSLYRNFGDQAEVLTRLFARKYGAEGVYRSIPDISIRELVQNSLESSEARYLLLICSPEIAIYMANHYQKHVETHYLYGSHMPGDKKGQEYSTRRLSDIVLFMESGISLILADLDQLYTSLYGLFNQNFAAVKGRKYCRVALGSQFNPRCFVHDHFRTIVTMEEDRLEQTDVPFLSRFEKHRVEIDQLLSLHQQQAFEQVYQWLKRLLQLRSGKQPALQIHHIFPLFSEDYLKLMTLYFSEETSPAELSDRCKSELLRTSSEDLLLVSSVSVLTEKEGGALRKQWQALHCTDLQSYLSSFRKSKDYSRTLVLTHDKDILEAEDLPKSICLQQFSVFQREQDLLESLAHFNSHPSQQLYLLDFDLLKHSAHLRMLKAALEETHLYQDKKICLLMRITRNAKPNVQGCWFGTWDKQFLGVLKSSAFHLPSDCASMTISEWFNSPLYPFEDEIQRITLETFQRMDLHSLEDVSAHMVRVSNELSQKPELQQALKTKLSEMMETQEPREAWIEEMLCNAYCVGTISSMQAALKHAVEAVVLRLYPVLLFGLESEGAWHSVFTDIPGAKLLQAVCLQGFQSLPCDFTLHPTRSSNKLELKRSLAFPFSYKEYQMLTGLYAEYRSCSGEAGRLEFQQRYRERTVLRCAYRAICAESSLVELYLRDLVHIKMNDQSVLRRFETLIWETYRSLCMNYELIEDKVFVLLDDSDFLLNLCEFLLKLEGIEPNIFEQTYEALVGLKQEVFTRLASLQTSVSQGYKEKAVLLAAESVKQVINAVVSKPTTNLKRVAVDLRSLETACQSLSQACEVPRTELLIWCSATDVLCQSEKGIQLFGQLSDLVRADSSDQYLFNPRFASAFIECMERAETPEAVQRFKSVYYVQLLLHNSSFLLLIVNDINNPDSEFWRFSGVIVELALKQAGLFKPFFTADGKMRALENALAQAHTESKFAMICSDSLVRYQTSIAEEDKEMLVKHKELLKSCLVPVAVYSVVAKIHNCARLRVYLESYCRLLVADARLSPIESAVMKEIDEFLVSPKFPAAREYAIKFIKQSQDWGLEGLEAWMKSRPAVSWLGHFNFSGPQSCASPEMPAEAWQIFNQTSRALTALCKNVANVSLEPVLLQLRSGNARAGFATALLCKCTSLNRDLILEHLNSLNALLEARLGVALHRLVCHIVKGFDPSPLEGAQGQGLCLCLIQMLSKTSALTSLFLNSEGQVAPDLTRRLNSSYVYGVGINPLYDSLFSTKEHYNSLKNPNVSNSSVKGSANKCSCGYIYFIMNCGGANAQANCPICGELIGGSGQLVSRAGHCNLSDAEALEYLASQVTAYKANQERGLWVFPAAFAGALEYRQTSQLAHTLLHLLLFVLLHWLNVCQLLSDSALAALFNSRAPLANISNFLVSTIEEDYRAIKTALTFPEAHLWWLALSTKLGTFIESHSESCVSLSERTTLERDFNQLAASLFESPVSIVLQEKRRMECPNFQINVIEEIVHPTGCPEISLFRVTQKPTFEALHCSFERQGLQQKYPLVALYLEIVDDLIRLQALLPVVALSNHLLHYFNHRIRRDEATSKRISTILSTDSKLNSLYTKFKKAWNSHLSIKLRVDCHELEPLVIKDNLELSYFLPDKLEAGGGLYLTAALTTLTEIQNKALNGLMDYLISKTGLEPGQLMDQRQYAVQSILSDYIINEEIDWNSCCVNNWEYGKGVELVFNFERLQELLHRVFAKGKFLTTNNISFIHYQFEMLCSVSDTSDLISRIRSMVKQEEIPIEEAKRVVRNAVGTNETKEEQALELLEIYEGLERLMCFLKHSSIAADTSIQSFAAEHSSLELSSRLVQSTTLSQLPLSCIVSLFEILEIELFPTIQAHVRAEYKSKSTETSQVIKEINWASLPSVEAARCAVLRLAVRLLVSGDLDSSQPLALYIVRPDFWNKTSEKYIEAFAEQLKDIPLAHTMQVFQSLEDMKPTSSRPCPPKAASKVGPKAGRKATHYGVG